MASTRRRRTTYRVHASEEDEQKALIQWADQFGPPVSLMFAIPNGGDRNPIVAAKLKAGGVRAGVPDLFLPYPHGGYAGLFIELKTTKGRPTRAQLAWIECLNHHGFMALVCHGWIEARDAILAYLQASRGLEVVTDDREGRERGE